MKPIFNFITNNFQDFVEKFIVHIPEDKKEEFRNHAEDMVIKAIEAGAKGATEGLKNG